MSKIPGKIPAIKSWSMLTWATKPYKMRGREGGNKSPRLPQVVTIPRLNFSEYFSEIKMGYKRPPIAMMVTPLAPVNAVKKAQVKRVTIATPPGIHPTQALATSISRLGVPLSAMMYPAKVKRGIVNRVGAEAIRYISTITAEGSIPEK